MENSITQAIYIAVLTMFCLGGTIFVVFFLGWVAVDAQHTRNPGVYTHPTKGVRNSRKRRK